MVPTTHNLTPRADVGGRRLCQHLAITPFRSGRRRAQFQCITRENKGHEAYRLDDRIPCDLPSGGRPLEAEQWDATALLQLTPASVPDHNCIICGPPPALLPAAGGLSAGAAAASAGEPLPTKNCTFCHGVSAQGLATAPRLAGQRAAYIEKQLGAFRKHLRDNPYSKLYMWNAVANLQPATGRALADYFSQQAPRAAADGRRRLVDQGRALYQQGVADANIVTCVVCHGPNAEGVRDIPAPWRPVLPLSEARGSRNGTKATIRRRRRCRQVMRDLSAAEIDAIASYLSFLDDQSASR